MKIATKSLLIIMLLQLTACTSGPAEKTQPASITSPAQLLDRGITHYNDNNYAGASKSFQKALLQYRSIDDQTGIANSCLNLSKTYMAINNNQLAAAYLERAEAIIEQASLHELDEHLALLKSSLAIKLQSYEDAARILEPVLNSSKPSTRLAALKNRTRIAFILDDNDKPQWLAKYASLQQKHAAGDSSHHARVLRFEAELADDETARQELLAISLEISRLLADRPAIAATLMQMAQADITAKNFKHAEDRLLRALLIRHQLGDISSTLALLEELQAVYTETGDVKAELTQKWISRIHADQLGSWDILFTDFDTYPNP